MVAASTLHWFSRKGASRHGPNGRRSFQLFLEPLEDRCVLAVVSPVPVGQVAPQSPPSQQAIVGPQTPSGPVGAVAPQAQAPQAAINSSIVQGTVFGQPLGSPPFIFSLPTT